jgi:ribonuclease HII
MTKQERIEKQKRRLAELKAPEDELRRSGVKYFAGIDEVGRGPLAGPVYAACVVMPDDWDIPGVDDSKKVTAKKRKELASLIREKAVACGIGTASSREIDEMNILEATKKAMMRAVDSAQDDMPDGEKIELLLIDAVHLEDEEIPQRSVVKGDASFLSIAAASIVAKVARDSFMEEMDSVYPGYEFASNKGYGTKAHYDGLRELGPSPIHRRSFLKNFDEKHSNGGNGMAGRKIYAVRKGRRPGLYETWEECRAQVDGFPGAEYKSFRSKADAEAFLGGNDSSPAAADPDMYFAYVDGSYDVSNGNYSGAAVIIKDGNIVETLTGCRTDGENSGLRNVAGEIMGAEKAIDWCLRNGVKKLTVCHDYTGLGMWGDGKWKANLDLTKAYKAFVAEARTSMEITFVKVKGHSGDRYNEMADGLAKQALEEVR